MSRYLWVVWFVCSLAVGQLGAAPPALTLPDKVQGKVGTFIRVSAQTAGKTVAWTVIDPGLNLFPPDLLRDTHTAVVTAEAPGNYRLLAVTAAADEVSPLVVCTVVVEGPAPVPPPPVPPVPPPPSDPLIPLLQAAYTTDSDTGKVQHVKDLAALYRQAATATVNDPGIGTTIKLLQTLQQARALLMPDTAISNVRNEIAKELNKTLSSPTALSTDRRTEIGKLFARIATCLESVH